MNVKRLKGNTFTIELTDEQLEVLKREVERERKEFGVGVCDNLEFSIGCAFIMGIDTMKRIQGVDK